MTASARPKRAEKRKVLPRPGALSTPIRPPISSTSRAAMLSPSPLPSKRRAVDGSACSNGAKMRARSSGAMPMPVSLTSKVRMTNDESPMTKEDV